MLVWLKKYAQMIFTKWVDEEKKEFKSLLEIKPHCRLLDLGCGTALLTKEFAKTCHADEVIGVDSLASRLVKKFTNFKYVKSDLNQKLLLPKDHYDVVVSHFSLEHLYDSGVFLSEIYRLLKPGGYLVISTDNLSCWPNIVSLAMGWQPFSTAGGVNKGSLGNPLGLRAGFITDKYVSGKFGHNKVMAYQMLVDAFRSYNFKIEKISGVGYFPYFGLLEKIMNKIDLRHAHFLILKVKKL